MSERGGAFERLARRAGVLAGACAVLGGSASAQPVLRVYVDDSAPAGGDGSSWQRAFRDLNDALDVAKDARTPTEVRVGQGVYRPDGGTRDRARSFDLGSGFSLGGITAQAGGDGGSGLAGSGLVGSGLGGWPAGFVIDGRTGRVLSDDESAAASTGSAVVLSLRVRGGFAGVGAGNPDLHDSSRFVSVLTGDLLGNDLNGQRNRQDNSYSVVRSSGVNFAGDGAFSLEDLVIRGGSADMFTPLPFIGLPGTVGGALYVDGPGPSVGSGISVVMLGCRVTDNFASRGGGGVFSFQGVRAEGCEITENVCVQNGGGVYVEGPSRSFVATESVVADNIASAGGGVFLDGLVVAAERSVFAGNAALRGGAIAMAGNGHQIEFRAEGSLFVMNTGSAGGGAVDAENSPSSERLRLEIVSCTFADNRGAGVADVRASGTLRGNIEGCVFDDPEIAGQFSVFAPSMSSAQAIDTRINASWTGRRNRVTEEQPQFLDQEGETWRDRDYRLRPTSRLIDYSDRDFFFGNDRPDIEGNPRRINDVYTVGLFEDQFSTTTVPIDLGCYEFVGRCTASDVLWPPGVVDSGDLQLMIQLFINADPAVDVDGGGSIDSGDLQFLLESFIDAFQNGC